MSSKISRRKFLKLVAGSGAVGFGVMAAGCKGKPSGAEGWIPDQYQGKGDFPACSKLDVTCPQLSLCLGQCQVNSVGLAS